MKRSSSRVDSRSKKATRSRVLDTKTSKVYPYQVTCTACDARLVAVEREWLVLIGPRPIELAGDLDGNTHIACQHCGNIVLLDRDLLSLL